MYAFVSCSVCHFSLQACFSFILLRAIGCGNNRANKSFVFAMDKNVALSLSKKETRLMPWHLLALYRQRSDFFPLSERPIKIVFYIAIDLSEQYGD